MSRPPKNGGAWSSAHDDGWGSATTVRGGSPRTSARDTFRTPEAPPRRDSRDARDAHDDGWSPAGPAPRDQQRANRAAEKRTERAVRDLERNREAATRPPERGVRAWFALLIVLIVAAIGGIVDTAGDAQNGFNVGIVVASVIGILIVKRSNMFPVVIAPPIVYTLGAAFQYIVNASGGNATKAKIDAASNYLVYGFPAIAIATAAVLIIAGARLILRK